MEIEERLHEVVLLKSGGYFTCAQSADLQAGVVFLFFRSPREIYYRVFRLKISTHLWPPWLSHEQDGAGDFTSALYPQERCDEVPLILSNRPYFTLSPSGTIASPTELFAAGEVVFVEHDHPFVSWLKHPLIDNVPCTNFEIDSEWIRLLQPPDCLKALISRTLQKENLLDTFLNQVPEDPDRARKELFAAFMYIFSCIKDDRDHDHDHDADLPLVICWDPPLPFTCAMYFAVRELRLHDRATFLDDVIRVTEPGLTSSETERLQCIWWCVHNHKLPASSLYQACYDRQIYLECVIHKLCSAEAETTDDPPAAAAAAPASGGFLAELLPLYGIHRGDFQTFLRDVCARVSSGDDLQSLVGLYSDADYLHLLEDDLQSTFQNLSLCENHFMDVLFERYVSGRSR